MNTAGPGLERGERAPDFALPLQDGPPTRFYSRAGGCPVVLFLFDPAQAGELAKLAEIVLEAGPAAPEVLAVVGPENGAIPHLGDLPFPVFTDLAGAVRKGFRLTPAALVTALITERGVCEPSSEGLLGLYPERRTRGGRPARRR